MEIKKEVPISSQSESKEQTLSSKQADAASVVTGKVPLPSSEKSNPDEVLTDKPNDNLMERSVEKQGFSRQIKPIAVNGKIRKKIINNVLSVIATAGVALFFITGGFANTGYVWVFIFHTCAFFLLGKRATYWVLLLLVVLLASLVLHGLGLLVLPYSYGVIFNFFLILLFFVGIMFFFQHKKDKEDKLLGRKLEYLKNERLVQGFLQVRTLELERTKIAMMRMSKDVLEERDRLEKERAKDKAILESIGEGLFATDLDGSIVLINSVAQDLLELNEEVIGKLIHKSFVLYDEKDNIVSEEEWPIFLTLQKAGEINKTYFYVRKDGKKVSLNITTSPIKQRDKIIGVISTVRDVTKEREVDRMKSEFISLASHQLRTPLSAIKWFAEMLLAGDAGVLNPEQNDFARNISDSTERMIALVNSLLNISRIESGRIMISPEPTDIKKLVEDVAKELSVKFDHKKQTFVLSVHHDLPKINIDPRLISQVYLNLLTNAIKYSPEKSEIVVFISRKNDEIITQVSDNGYGIPKYQQSKVFQKFFRAVNAVKRETDGTGLGLYLIKAIIESSKGEIWFQSEEGKGTTFWFSLPISGVEPKKGEVTLDSSI